MRRIVKYSLILFMIVALILNFSPLLRYALDFGKDFGYTTQQGQRFWEVSSKSPNFENVARNFERYKRRHPNTTDTVLYRTFWRNPIYV